MRISVTRTTVLPGAPDAVFDRIAAEDVLPRLLTGYGPLPAVVGTEAVSGPWDRPGSQRRVVLADGTRAREQVTEYERPRTFAYRVWDFGHPVVGALAGEAQGHWTFEQAPGGTRIAWTYTFFARSRLRGLPLRVITMLFWRGYMQVCLRNAHRLLAHDAERGHPPAAATGATR